MKKGRIKKSNRIVLIAFIAMVCAGIALFGVFFARSFSRAAGTADGDATALTIGEETFTLAECNALYAMIRDQLISGAGANAAMMGLDLSRPLNEQPCTISEEEQTWHDYVKESALDQLVETEAVCAAAGIAGEEPEPADTFVQTISNRQSLSDSYKQEKMQAFTFSEEEVTQYYKDHARQYATFTYLNAFVGNVDDPAAEKASESLLAAADAEEFKETAREHTGQAPYELAGVSGGELGDETAPDVKWLTDPVRKEGDTWIGGSGQAGYVLFFCARDDHGYGEEERGAWFDMAQEGLANEALDAWIEAEKEKMKITFGKTWDEVGLSG